MAINEIKPADIVNKGVIGLADVPGLTTAEMQKRMDELATDVIIPKVNELVKEANSTNESLAEKSPKILAEKQNATSLLEWCKSNLNADIPIRTLVYEGFAWADCPLGDHWGTVVAEGVDYSLGIKVNCITNGGNVIWQNVITNSGEWAGEWGRLVLNSDLEPKTVNLTLGTNVSSGGAGWARKIGRMVTFSLILKADADLSGSSTLLTLSEVPFNRTDLIVRKNNNAIGGTYINTAGQMVLNGLAVSSGELLFISGSYMTAS